MIILARLGINAFAIWLAASWINGIELVSPRAGFWPKLGVLFAVALVFTLVNMVVKPIVQLLSLPLVVLTLGLFLLVINALMLWLTAKISETTDYGLRVEHFWPAVWGALIISVVNWLLGVFVPDRRVRD